MRCWTPTASATYETRPGPWNISLGAIWIRDAADVAEARRLLAAYQAERGARARAEFEAARRDGTAGSLWTEFCTEPLRVLLVLAGILLALALAALPVLLIGR